MYQFINYNIHTGSLLDSDGRAIRLSCDSWTPLDCTLDRDQSAVYDYFSDWSVNFGNLQNVLVLGGYSSGKSTLLANIAQVLKRRYPRSGILILASSPTHCCIFKSLFRRKFVSLDAMTYAQVESFSGNVGKFDFVLCDDAHLMTPGVMGEDKGNGLLRHCFRKSPLLSRLSA